VARRRSQKLRRKTMKPKRSRLKSAPNTPSNPRHSQLLRVKHLLGMRRARSRILR